MKGKFIISSLFSVLLCLWYLAAIVGFDIHTDHHGGEVFVVSLLLGHTDCESLHPENECHCMAHHHGACQADDEDCENEVSLLSLTGDGNDFTFSLTPVISFFQTILTPVSFSVGDNGNNSLHFSEAPPRHRLRTLCVLRV